MQPFAHFLTLLFLAIAMYGCGGDIEKAEEGAKWLQERYMFRPFGNIGEITKIYVEDAEQIRLEVELTEQASAQLIDAQNLMIQSLIAKYACPRKATKLWMILGDDVQLRIDLKHAGAQVASALCMPE
jgi:hypothetical protein